MKKRKIAKTFKKSLKINYPKKVELFYFEIAGLIYAFKNKRDLKKALTDLKKGVQVTLKHEFRNQFDEYACAIYLDKKRMGYMPRSQNKKFLKLVERQKKFIFFVNKAVSYDFFIENYVSPEIIAIGI